MARRRNILTVRLDDSELVTVKKLANDLGVPVAEVWRRLLITVRVLYDSDLMLGDALRVSESTMGVHKLLKKDGDIPLYDAIKPIPELIRILEAKETIKVLEESKKS
ncbi:MAG: hypothetical protein HWN51_02720 [Desulfobacterales bacterium]|nr:hypothetical protein [Desulfobacterales bacterium]